MKVKRDQITGAGLVVLGIVVYVLVSQFSIDIQPGNPGPKVFPLIAAFGFIICGIGIFVQGMLSKAEEKVYLSLAGWRKVLAAIALLALYIFTMKYVGYLLVTPLLLFAMSTLFVYGKPSKLWARIVFAVVFTLFIYVIYVYVFGLTLPAGSLF